MKLNFSWISILLLIYIFTSCKESDRIQSEVITIDLTSCYITGLNLDNCQTTELQTTDSCQIGTIISAIEYNDELIIFSRGIAYSFKIEDGTFLRRFGIGASASCMYNNGNVFGLFSFNEKIVSEYDENGKLISKRKVHPNKQGIFPALIRPLNENDYISLNSFYGSDQQSPEFSILNKNFEYTKTYSSLMISNGFYQNNLVISPNHKLYYAPPFESSIYSIDENEIEKCYSLTFGQNAIPDSIVKKGFMQSLEWTRANPKFTGYITYCYLIGENLVFAGFIDGNFCIMTFNANSNKCSAFKLNVEIPYNLQQVVCYGKNCIYLFKTNNNDLNENPSVIKLNYPNIGIK